MKKTLSLSLALLLLLSLFVSCGQKADEPQETTKTNTTINTEPPQKETTTKNESTTKDIYTNHTPTELSKPLEEYDFVHTFKAPEGNPRDIVYNYMYAMSQIEWVATESWVTTWKEQGDFGVNLSYDAGKTYYGVPYSRTNGTLDEFEQYVINGTFKPNSPYYEEIVGNHCSSSMVMAFQQVVDLTYTGSLKPTVSRTGLIQFPDGIEIPPARANNPSNPDNWISETVFAHNGQEAIYNGYAQLDKGDILYKNIDGSGHSRMVSKVEIFKSPTGKLMPNRSYVYCIEQTNAWYDGNKNSTWWIDKKYSFSTLWDTFFMPTTLCIYHEETPVITDAYITMTGKNTPESIEKSLKGTLESNYPMTYARITITDKNGNIVAESLKYNLTKEYKINLRSMHNNLKMSELPAGTYTYKLRAGIARGGVDIETFEFTKN
ncbi:MAG: hypothetical protein IKU45_04100 [Clostridia bacterium]|nr:hypothetical protein [Clostridia bacterium]